MADYLRNLPRHGHWRGHTVDGPFRGADHCPGHALFAHRHLGMIALAGIIVRNSILLVDFTTRNPKVRFADAVIVAGSGTVTSHCADRRGGHDRCVLYSDDPIFNGLAIALIFGSGLPR